MVTKGDPSLGAPRARCGIRAGALLALLWPMLLASASWSQEYGARLGTVQRGGKVSFEPTGPGVFLDALDPVVRKWYVPQELYAEYGWRQWEYSNYARNAYQRYVNTGIEGEYFYDVYGNFLTRGWLIYDWREEGPQPFGSSLIKSGRFSSWFSRLVVAADHKGQYHYSITLGDEIRTTLTPMTFSKPKFNGLQWDFAADKYTATVLLSRASAPNQEATGFTTGGDRRTDVSNLAAGRFVAQVGDFVNVGTTIVSAYQSNTQAGAFSGDVFAGQLSGPQNFSNVTAIEVRIRDDSPEDGEDGGALFAADILISDLEGKQTRGSEIGFRPQIEGGFLRHGYLSADGNETIVVRFDFNDRTYSGPDPGNIERVQIELVVANDYIIEMSSDRHEGAFLRVAQARGNVRDSSNQRVVLLDYGLPTANQIVGFTLGLTDLAGFDGYFEYNRNRQYRQYPNLGRDHHHTTSARADAWLVNLSRSFYPWFAFGEAFRVAPEYQTSMSLLDAEGDPRYADEFWRYEFVEDNDDQDQYPDWTRKGSATADREVFPGWDENNDFVSDFNQNDSESSPNLIPDYEEPFLRFHVDRPEFQYGIDMNHNQWVDRFENDEEPDYPYARDKRGYNAYVGAYIGPDTRLHLGRQRTHQITQDRRNFADYLLLTLDKDSATWGRLRLFQDLQKVKDTIRDDLLQWVQEESTRGNQRLVRDIRPAQDTWINTTWIGHDWRPFPGFFAAHKIKWQHYRQLGSDDEVELRGARRQGHFLGLIDKAEYRFNMADLTVIPRWKSEYRSQAPVDRLEPRRRELVELAMLILRYPVLRRSVLEGGVEYQWYRQMQKPIPPGAEDDFRDLVVSAQLTNLSDYQGYRITTLLGFEVARRVQAGQDTRTGTRAFVTLYAGVDQ